MTRASNGRSVQGRTLSRRALVAAALATPFAARAQAWLPDPVRIIIPTAAGGALDSIARLLQPQLQHALGVTVIVENRTGASSTIGALSVAKSPPDGGTWLFSSDSILAGPLLMGNVGYDVQKDLEPVTMIADGPMVLCCHPSRPYRSLADIVAAAQAKPDSISCGTTGVGGTGHLSLAALSKRTGMRLVHIPYRGGGPAVNDTVAGHTDTIMSSTATLAQQIEAGKLRPLVQCGAQRAGFLPEVPTAQESGVADFQAGSWYSFFAPGGTPPALIARFHDLLVSIAGEPRMRREIADKFRVEVPLLAPSQVRAVIAKQLVTWAEVIRENNIKAGG